MMSEYIPKTPPDQLNQFGMLYEKYVFGKLIRNLVEQYKIKTVCEFPYNQLMGEDNNEYFKKNGCEVIRYRKYEDSREKDKFDLVWNFCEFERSSSPEYIISTMKKLSCNYLLVITQNRYNVMLFHYWYHLYKRRSWDHGSIGRMNYRACIKEMKKHNIKILKTGAFDVPWFVLDFYEGGKFFRGLAPKNMINAQNIKESFFEKLPRPFKFLLAHHHYVLGQKR